MCARSVLCFILLLGINTITGSSDLLEASYRKFHWKLIIGAVAPVVPSFVRSSDGDRIPTLLRRIAVDFPEKLDIVEFQSNNKILWENARPHNK